MLFCCRDMLSFREGYLGGFMLVAVAINWAMELPLGMFALFCLYYTRTFSSTHFHSKSMQI